MAPKLPLSRLSVEELASQFDGKWVLLDDPGVDEAGQVLDGIVVAFSDSADEIYEAAGQAQLDHGAILSFVKLPEGSVYIL